MHVSAYALIALCFHSDNVLSFSIGWEEYFIKAQQSCTTLPPSQRHSCNCSLTHVHTSHAQVPTTVVANSLKRWGCILGTFVPQPEHSAFQLSDQSHSNRSTASTARGSGWDWHTDTEEVAILMISVAYLLYNTPATGQMYKYYKNMAIFHFNKM